MFICEKCHLVNKTYLTACTKIHPLKKKTNNLNKQPVYSPKMININLINIDFRMRCVVGKKSFYFIQ